MGQNCRQYSNLNKKFTSKTIRIEKYNFNKISNNKNVFLETGNNQIGEIILPQTLSIKLIKASEVFKTLFLTLDRLPQHKRFGSLDEPMNHA